mgnify:CR=1 FL=1
MNTGELKRVREGEEDINRAAKTLTTMHNTPMSRSEHNDAVGGLEDIYKQLQAKGFFPNPDAKKVFIKLVDNGTFKRDLINKSLNDLPYISVMNGGRGRGKKQHGGKDCDKTDYAILIAMMAVFYWTGAMDSIVSSINNNVAPYIPTPELLSNTLSNTLSASWSYIIAFVPAAFPLDDLSYAMNNVRNTLFKKIGEMFIVLVEAANLSLKLGFSAGAATIWNTTLSWVKDNPTIVLGAFASRKALSWRQGAQQLQLLQDNNMELTPDDKKTYKDMFISTIKQAKNSLCDLTGVLRAGPGKMKEWNDNRNATQAKSVNSMSTTMDANMNDEIQPKEIQEALNLLALMAANKNVSYEEQSYDSEDENYKSYKGGRKISTRKRASRKSCKSKSRNIKKCKISGRKKASRKGSNGKAKGRKTRRNGSKKR